MGGEESIDLAGLEMTKRENDLWREEERVLV